MRISEHFTSEELACQGLHCCGHSSPIPDQRLIIALETFRGFVGVPVIITSGYRCNVHNAETLGSVGGSEHTCNRAADIMAAGKTGAELAAIAEQVPAFAMGGIGTYDDRIHVDIGKYRRWDNRTKGK